MERQHLNTNNILLRNLSTVEIETKVATMFTTLVITTDIREELSPNPKLLKNGSINNTFLNRVSLKDIFIPLPKGFIDPQESSNVCKL